MNERHEAMMRHIRTIRKMIGGALVAVFTALPAAMVLGQAAAPAPQAADQRIPLDPDGALRLVVPPRPTAPGHLPPRPVAVRGPTVMWLVNGLPAVASAKAAES